MKRVEKPKNKKRVHSVILFGLILVIVLIICFIKSKDNCDDLCQFKKGGLTLVSVELAKKIINDPTIDITDDGYLDQIKSITPEAAREFFKSSNYVYDTPDVSLNGLTGISIELLEQILPKRSIGFDGLKTISVGVAKELANSNSLYLNLKGIETISPEATKELAKYEAFIIGSDYLMKELKKYNYSPSEETLKAYE